MASALYIRNASRAQLIKYLRENGAVFSRDATTQQLRTAAAALRESKEEATA